MKYFICLLLFPFLLLGNEKQPPLTPKKVTVFLSGAQVSATAKTTLIEGNNVLLFSDLSPNIKQNSIQVKGLNRVSVNTVQFGISFLKQQEVSAELKDLNLKLQDYKDQIAKKQSAIDALKTEESVLAQNKTILSEKNTSLDQLKAYSNYYRIRSEEINNALYQLQKEHQNLNDETNKLQLQINNLEGKNRTTRGEIKLVLNSDIAQSINLEITYLVEDAGWYPNYEIRATNTDSPIHFLYQANMFQNTGEDWKDVEVTLSTADPSINNQKPQILPYYLNFDEPRYSVRGNSMQPKNESLDEVVVSSYESDVRGKLEGAAMAVVAEEQVLKTEQLTVMNFKLPKKYSIKSKDEPLKVKLDEQDVEAEYEYYTAPVLDANVYLTATLTNWESLDLLPGEARIYFEDTFSGIVFLDANINTEDFVISLGNDQSLVVERKQVNKMKSKSFFRNNSIVEKKFEISVRNNKNVALEVKVEDRIPISQNEQIKLSDEVFEGATIAKDTGILTWVVKLSPKSKQTQSFAYKVTYPKGKHLNLER